MTRISICIATYRRPKGLMRLLRSLDGLETRELKDSRIAVAVVDNDREPSSRNIVLEWEKQTRYQVLFVHEPRKGIPYARNRCFELADDADFIAFIDDDEAADGAWLQELCKVQEKYNADAVVGRVVPAFETEVPEKVKMRFERPRYETGTALRTLNTGNVLIRREVLEKIAGPFDISRQFSGGTDTLLGRKLYAMGARIIWADEAKVVEFNPPERCSLRWHLQRAFRSANGLGIQSRFSSPENGEAVIPFLKCIAKIGIGVPLILFGWPISREATYKGLLLSAKGAGGLAGHLGLVYNEYVSNEERRERRWQWLRGSGVDKEIIGQQ